MSPSGTLASISSVSATSCPLRSLGREVLHLGVLTACAVLTTHHRPDAGPRRNRLRGRRVEPRPDDHREDVLKRAVPVGQGVEVGDRHVDRTAGLDVRDLLREDVWPLLREERGNVALRPRLGVHLFGLGLVADDAADATLTNGHDELVHRRVLRQREHVHRLDLAVVGVLELLRDNG